jgi:nitroreductase
MNTLEAISTRRSIRKFKSDPIPDEALHTILNAAILAPSGKNKQPWRFIVVQGEQRADMVRVMRAGIAKFKDTGEGTGSSEWTANVMEQAPITVFVFNPEGLPPWENHNLYQNIDEIVDTQSVGAAIQNMLLAALELGIGSLWICDVFYAYEELCGWLGEQGEMIAAVSFGYPAENPPARPRKAYDAVVRVKE